MILLIPLYFLAIAYIFAWCQSFPLSTCHLVAQPIIPPDLSGRPRRPANSDVRFFMRTIFCAVVIALLVLSGNSFADGIGCPAGTTPSGKITPDVSDAWCEIIKDGKVVMHGPYRSWWWPNGKLGTEGQYSYGQMTGKWRGWYKNRKLQYEEWYENGHKVKGLYWDKNGIKLQELKLPYEDLPYGRP